MYKIYFDNRVIYLTDKNTINSKNIYEYSTKEELYKFIDSFIKGNSESAVVLNNDVENLYEQFKSYFKYIEAAGGFIINDRDELLVMYRLEKWDLPKGKVELGESVEEAAVREVQEETGLKNPTIVSALKPIYHTYLLKGRYVLKKTYWFRMKTTEHEITPQVEENITEVRWIDKSKKQEIVSNTYASIQNVFEDANW